MALDVHRHGIHRDMRRCNFDMDAECCRAAAQALRPDTQFIDGFGQLFLNLRALGIATDTSEWARGSHFRQMHAKIRSPSNADTNNRWRTYPAAAFNDAVDHKSLDRANSVRRNQHLQERAILRAGAFRDHLDLDAFIAIRKREIHDRNSRSAGCLLIEPRNGMNDRRAERSLAGC